MQRRTWAIAGGVGLLFAMGAVGYGIRKGRHKQPHVAADAPAAQRARSQPAAAPGPSAAPAASSPPPKVKPPELSGITGSCLQEREGGRICTDYMADPEQVLAMKARCHQGHQFTQATWSDKPCDHAASNGGCWTSRKSPTRIKWFYGNIFPDFKPGPETRRVCGPQAVGYTREGKPVNHDGASLDDAGSPGAAKTAPDPPGPDPTDVDQP